MAFLCKHVADSLCNPGHIQILHLINNFHDAVMDIKKITGVLYKTQLYNLFKDTAF